MKKSSKPNRIVKHITPRDILIAEKVFTTRYMTTPQIWRLFFRHTKHYLVCNQRLKKLVDYGILRVIEQAIKRGEGRKPYIYALAPLGGELLVQERGVNPNLINTTPWANEANNLKINHILATTDCLIAIDEACATSEFRLEAWETEREIRSQLNKETVRFVGDDGQTYRTPVCDLHFVLSRGEKRALYWLEVDRATEDIALATFERQSITGKIIEFLAWEHSEHYRATYGTRLLRVLFATTGVRRMHNMKKATEKILRQWVELPDQIPEDAVGQQGYEQKWAEYLRLGKRFRFTTLDQVTSQNVLTQPIWHLAGLETPQTMFA